MNTGLNYFQWKTEFEAEKMRLGLQGASPEELFLTSAEQRIGVPFLKSTEETFSPEVFDRLFQTYLLTYDLTPQLSSLTLPILNIYSERDVRFPPRVGKTFRTFNERIRDLEISGAGHFPFLLDHGRRSIHEALRAQFTRTSSSQAGSSSILP